MFLTEMRSRETLINSIDHQFKTWYKCTISTFHEKWLEKQSSYVLSSIICLHTDFMVIKTNGKTQIKIHIQCACTNSITFNKQLIEVQLCDGHKSGSLDWDWLHDVKFWNKKRTLKCNNFSFQNISNKTQGKNHFSQ